MVTLIILVATNHNRLGHLANQSSVGSQKGEVLRNRTFYQTVSNTEKRGDAAMYIMRNLKCVLTLDACNPILIDARSKWDKMGQK